MAHLFSELDKDELLLQIRRNLISRYHPLKEEEILKHRDKLNFESYGLIKNEQVTWSHSMVRELKEKIDWQALWLIRSLCIDLAFLIEFEDRIDFTNIGWARNISWSDGIVELFGQRVEWKAWACSSGILNSPQKIDRLKDNLDWKIFSMHVRTEFSDHIMERFAEYWNYDSLSSNPHLPISAVFLKKYGDKLNFTRLSRNPACWPLIKRYPHSKKWNWKRVTQNPAIEYNDESFHWVFAHFKNSLDLPPILTHSKRGDEFSMKLFLKGIFLSYRNDLDYLFTEEFVQHIDWEHLSKTCNTPFSHQFLDKYWQNIDFRQPQAIKCAQGWITEDFLRSNLRLFKKQSHYFYHLPLKKSMLPSIANEIHWIWLSTASKLDWDWNFIRQNLDKFNPYQLSQNEGIYEQLVLPELKEHGLETMLR